MLGDPEMDEDKQSSSRDVIPPRRAFFTTAAIGLTGFATGLAGLAGCRGEEPTITEGDSDDLASLRRVDPKLIKYRETSHQETGLQEPRAITTDASGNLFVVGDRQIRI